MIKLALYSAMSDRASEARVALVDSWSFGEPSTRAAALALNVLGFDGKVLVVLAEDDMVAEMSFRNLPRVQTI
ncbi:50S ribosomal protein L4, partial [mine drainage metagenome]